MRLLYPERNVLVPSKARPGNNCSGYLGTADRDGFISPQKVKCVKKKNVLWYLFVPLLPGGGQRSVSGTVLVEKKCFTI